MADTSIPEVDPHRSLLLRWRSLRDQINGSDAAGDLADEFLGLALPCQVRASFSLSQKLSGTDCLHLNR